MKKFAIINSENKELIDAINAYFGGNCPVLSKDDNLNGYELIILTGYEMEFPAVTGADIINIHQSILPAFKGENALMQAFLAGVKVTGITIHRVESGNFYGKILAQYPVLIGLTTHIDEINLELAAIAKKLYPAVIEALINDRVFDFADLFKNSCSHHGGCSGCTGKNTGCGGCH